MRYISICSGIEAATVAWRPLGWEAVALAEIEPFPNAVLAHHYPRIPNLGDITKVDWRKYAGAVDLVVGGTPCQSFSVAGKREGLDGASGLVREYFRLLEEVRPRWFVWENVPGSLSSGRGNDFAFILRQWEKCGYHVAWRVLDAQFFGVPQRRRRVFAVGHLGGWQYPAAVLFESESLRGNPAPRRKAGKENSRGIAEGIGKAGRRTVSGKDVFPTLQANCGSKLWLGNQEAFSGDYFIKEETETLVLNDQEGTAPTLRAESGDNQPAVFCIAGNTIGRQIQNGGNGAGFQQEISYTLNTIDRHAVMCAPVALTIGASGPPYSRLGNERVETEALVVEPSVTPPITTKWAREGWTAYDETAPLVFRETADCLTAAYGTKWNGNASAENGYLFAMNRLVRRITPLECERLQGFPDGYTDIEFKGKPAPDGARYKALGNSMAVPCMRWIGERIQIVEDICQ